MAASVLLCVPLRHFQPTLAHCSPQSTTWKSSSRTSHHRLRTGQHTRGAHSVPPARARRQGFSMQPITTVRTWIREGDPLLQIPDTCISQSPQSQQSLEMTHHCVSRVASHSASFRSSVQSGAAL